MNKLRLSIIIAASIAIIGIFLPWISMVLGFSRSGIDMGGHISLIALIVVIFALFFKQNISKTPSLINSLVCLIASLIAVSSPVSALIEINNRINQVNNSIGFNSIFGSRGVGSFVSIQFGLWATLFASLAVLALSIWSTTIYRKQIAIISKNGKKAIIESAQKIQQETEKEASNDNPLTKDTKNNK